MNLVPGKRVRKLPRPADFDKDKSSPVWSAAVRRLTSSGDLEISRQANVLVWKLLAES